jgi:tripartite-type tricarboxylate transporter receptor subunit TctC
MRFPLRWALLAIGTLMSCGVPSVQAAATDYPSKPIRLIVPYPAGGGADHWGRLVAEQLANELGQPVVVDNIPGAGGNNGTTKAAGATPDGYTLLLGSIGPLAVHPFTYAALHFNATKDFVPIALLESSPILLVANPTVPVTSAKELIALARNQPDAVSYASNGDGSPEQVAGELFKKRLQLQIKHLPYDGAGPARKAVLAGQAGLMFDPCKGALPAIRNGLQKPLAVAASTRLPELPDVPTFGEIGVPHYELRIWTGVLAPTGTPRKIVDQLNRAIRDILRTDVMRQEISDEGGIAGNTTVPQFTAFIQAERQHWSALVAESGIPRVQVQ